MTRSASVSSACSSSHSVCASSSSHASSSSQRSFSYGHNSASTSMSSLDSCSGPAKRCSCDLTNEKRDKKLYLDHAQSTAGLWHGPLPIDEWKERFLPSCGATSSKLGLDAESNVHDAIALEEYITRSGLCATVFPRATLGVHGKDHTTNTFISADFSILSENMKIDHDSRLLRDELLSRTLAFGDVVSEEFDPCAFADGKPDTEDAAYTRGRLVSIMRAVAVNSHRTFCYAFVLMPTLARLIRFDHAGVVFSAIFPWRTSCDLLDFLTSFDRMSPAQRGCDTSVSTIAADSEEALQAMEILAGSDALPEGVEKSSVIPTAYHGSLSLMSVYDDEQKIFHQVVVHRPIKSVEYYIGRSTRGFYGVDLDEKAVVYVKDAWRIASTNAAPESASYRRLNKHDVPYLPGFYHGGDVPADAPTTPSSSVTASVQRTWSQDFVRNRDELLRRPGTINIGIDPHVHHRLLFKKIGRPLRTFGSTLQLCAALHHGLQSHGAAYKDAMILHRDISGGNILIDKDGCGMLIDWDMCVWRENKVEAEKIGQKIGTWAFMSATLLLGFDERPHLLRDDLESFVHILYYYVFRYRPTVPAGSSAQKRLLASMEKVFNTVLYTGGEVIGGDDKANDLASATHFDLRMMRDYVRPEPLLQLMLEARETFKPLYEPEPSLSRSLTGDAAAWQSRRLESHRQALDVASAQLESSEYLISLFSAWTQDYDPTCYQWPLDDAAADQQNSPRSSCPPKKISSTETHNGRKRSIDVVEETHSYVGKARRVTSDRNVSAGASARRRSALTQSQCSRSGLAPDA